MWFVVYFLLLCVLFAQHYVQRVYPIEARRACDVVCAAVEDWLGTVFIMRLEVAAAQPLLVQFYQVMYTYGRTVYILCAMVTGYLGTRVGMRPVDFPFPIVSVICHEQLGWLILVRLGCL